MNSGNILEYLRSSRDVIQLAMDDPDFIRSVAIISERIAGAIAAGNKVMLCGNGGSAADAQHFAGELLSRFDYDRMPTAAVALTADTAVMTAIGNDYGFDHVFERQVLGLGRPGDILLAISTSGRSVNILRAIDAARGRGLLVVGFTGKSGGEMPDRCDLCLRVPSDRTPLIQQVHLTAAHLICAMIEARLFPRDVRGAPD